MRSRRDVLGALAAMAAASRVAAAPASAALATAPVDTVRRGRAITFPHDHGAHVDSRIEWWYVTGWLGAELSQPSHGFQVTFFRRRTGLAEGIESRFAARHVLMGHAALTDVKRQTHQHAQRLARWAGDNQPSRRDRATVGGADVAIGAWHIRRANESAAAPWQARVEAPDWSLVMALQPTQGVLLQGDKGFSQKGPAADQASHYYTEPQLAVTAELQWQGRPQALQGRAWLDHEWSDTLLHPQAMGWDWMGINLDDGSALTAFALRRRDGSVLWAGGSFRRADGKTQIFGATDVKLAPGRTWRSPATAAVYPVQWGLTCPAGQFELRSALDAQELDSTATTGTVYWEGLSSLHGADGARLGWGYLEMTGYAGPVRW